jgi:hypothetical protein
MGSGTDIAGFDGHVRDIPIASKDRKKLGQMRTNEKDKVE